MFGSHLSIAGSMVNALTEATALNLDTVQVFTKNQQQWKVKPLDPATLADWLAQLKQRGWQTRTVSHASYLINLASPADELWNKSIELMIQEVNRCEQLSIPYLVHHPGSFVGSTLHAGIARIAAAYARILASTSGSNVILCLEGVSGAGSHIGAPFEQLAQLRSAILNASPLPSRVGFCLDTCHLHAAGHDLSTLASAQEVLTRFDDLCGISNIRVLHVNDSKGALASKLDRHEHLGHGWVGGGAKRHAASGDFSPPAFATSGFSAFVNHPHFATIPKILETPKGAAPDGTSWDTVNLLRLRSLISAPSLTPQNTSTQSATHRPANPGQTTPKASNPPSPRAPRAPRSPDPRTPTSAASNPSPTSTLPPASIPPSSKPSKNPRPRS